MSTDFSWKSPEERPILFHCFYPCLIGNGPTKYVAERRHMPNGFEMKTDEVLLGWTENTTLAALPVAAPPKRVCEKCGEDCVDHVACLQTRLSAAVARAEKAEANELKACRACDVAKHEANENLNALVSEVEKKMEAHKQLRIAARDRDAARRELAGIVEAGREWWEDLLANIEDESASGEIVRLHDALRPHMSPAAETAGKEQPLGDGRG